MQRREKQVDMLKTGAPKRRLLSFAIICLCLVLLYSLKNSAGINIFNNFSLSQYWPFSLLMPEYVIYPAPGQVLLDENFELDSPAQVNWLDVTTPDPGSVSLNHEQTRVNTSRYLVVRNANDQRWHITHRYFIAVKEAEKFSMEAMLRSAGSGGYAELQVSAIDDKGHIISRKMWRAGPGEQGKFELVRKLFTIPPGIARIRFRLAGAGRGEFMFDNIRFTRLPNDTEKAWGESKAGQAEEE